MLRDFEIDLIREFIRCDVNFVVIGGAAVVLHGYNRERKDLDVLIAQTKENLKKLREVDLNWITFDDKKIGGLGLPKARLPLNQGPIRLDILTILKGIEAEKVLR
jgi:hypothetical protein